MISELIFLVNQGRTSIGPSAPKGNYQLCKAGLSLLIYGMYSLIDSMLPFLQHLLIRSLLQSFKDLQHQICQLVHHQCS